jgi:hypothetical protein
MREGSNPPHVHTIEQSSASHYGFPHLGESANSVTNFNTTASLTPRLHRLYKGRVCYRFPSIEDLAQTSCRQYLHIGSSRARSSMDRAPDYG